MVNEPESVRGLIARFELRRLASSAAFNEGVDLARRGRVRVRDSPEYVLNADVDDDETYGVEIEALDGTLVGRCSCARTPPDSICRHQVAAAHTWWLLDLDARLD